MMDAEHTAPTERLWTPWRMGYISGTIRESGCIFCNRLSACTDVTSLILQRGEHSFVIMNLYPYNTGHIMLVPNQHAADAAELRRESLHEMAEMLPVLTTALRRVFDCDGFNVGLNIGSVAGAGVASHLHQHIVPRWQGDANFMPILASTMVIPETIPVTYAKIRAELERETGNATTAAFVLMDATGDAALLHHNRIPVVELLPERPVWKSIVDAVPDGVEQLEIGGWAGSDSTVPGSQATIALTLRGAFDGELPGGWQGARLDSESLDGETATMLNCALSRQSTAR